MIRPATAESRRDEAFRSLRSTIKFAAGDPPVRTVLIVDADRDQMSDSAEQVARAFAKAGDACAYVDGNFRGDASSVPGFSDLLIGSQPLDTVIEANAGDSVLTTISAGTVPDPDLLAGDQVSQVLDALLERFEFVIIGAASLPANSDAISLASRVDASILVVTSGETRRPRAIEARDALDRVGARVLGVVLIESRRRLFW
jgi:Mrp family chromosome partitioning ATPase